jgi:hypothetical protein
MVRSDCDGMWWSLQGWQESRRLKQSNGKLDSAANAVLQELLHTAHGAVTGC